VIIFAAWSAASDPGLAATALSVMAFDYFFLAPIYSFDLRVSDLPRLALFTAAALFGRWTDCCAKKHSELSAVAPDLERQGARSRETQCRAKNRKRRAAAGEARLLQAEREIRLTIDAIPTLAWPHPARWFCRVPQ